MCYWMCLSICLFILDQLWKIDSAGHLRKKLAMEKKGIPIFQKKKKFVIPSEGCSSPGFITSNRTTLIVSGKKKLN